MKQRSLLLWISSLVALLVAYTVVAGALRRPDILPTTPEILQTFGSLLVRGNPPPAGEMHHEHHQHQMRSSDQVDTLVQQGVTLQDALLVSTARVLFGLLVGLPLGILIGVLLGWSRPADDYLHSVYVLIRSVLPLGHSEAHRLIPIVYAVAVTAVIPTYHAVRDVAARYLVAARSLGARGR